MESNFKKFWSLKFFMKCHKPKFFIVIFFLLKYYQGQTLIGLCHQKNNTYNFQHKLFSILSITFSYR